MRRTLLIPVILAVVVGAAVVVLRRSPEPSPGTPPRPHPEPVEPVDKAPEPETRSVDPSPAREPRSEVDPRSAFDRLIEALRSGDRERIREALAELEGSLVPDPVPDAENAALIYAKAFEKLTEFSEAETAAYEAVANGRPLTAEQQESIRKLLEKNADSLALLKEAGALPKCRFPVDYAAGFSAELPHVSSVVQASKLLLLASRFGEEGPLDQASWRLSEALANEPLLVSQLVRSASHSLSGQGIQTHWKQNTPESLQRWIDEIDPGRMRESLERSILFELYAGTKLVVDDDVPDTFFALTGIEKPKGPLAKQALAEYAETLTQYASLAGRPYHEVRDTLAELERIKTESAPWYDVYSRQMLPALTRAASRQAETEAALGARRVAAALELFHRREGAYPSTLGDLGSILPDAPVDPFTGKPFVYRREGSGFMVYSLGEDGADGGGSAERDVVFRSPR